MKKILFLLVGLFLTFGILAGCNTGENALVEGKVNVVTSFFPLYDFTKKIGGEHVHVVNMVPAGVEPHDWTPKSQDMTYAAKAQMFVYQGSGFEAWTEDLLGGIENDERIVVEASQGIELLPAAPHNEEEQHAEHEAEHGAYDPHTWLSPRSALIMAENIKNGLVQADPEHASEFEQNYEAFVTELKALDQRFTDQLGAVSKREIVVSHEAFGYLARDYGLVELPMTGLAHEAEPTAQDLKEISEFVKEHDVRYIFTEELLSDALAKTLADDLGIETLTLHPIEGLTQEETQAGETYVSLMDKNLANLMKALQ